MTVPDFFYCSFYELMIIINAHRKKELKQWYHTRTISYCNMVANWQSDKKRPPSIEKYMPLDTDKSEVEHIDERMDHLFKAQEAYKARLKAKGVN
jgi:hypothetical protein